MLNFKGWKKIEEDGKTVTMEHPKGHSMTIALKALPKIQREQIKRIMLAKGTKEPLEKEYKNEESNVENNPAPENDLAQELANVPVPVDAPVPVPVPVAVSQPQSAPVSQPQQPAQAAPAAQSQPVQVPSSNAPAAVPQQGQTAQDKVVQAYKENLQDSENLQRRINQSSEMAQQATQRMDKYITENPINEKALMENMDTGHKIKAGIGLLLSGWGYGVAGHPELAMEFLNKQIDRNIEGQKARLGQQKTIYDSYQQLFGNDEISADLTKVNMLNRMNTKVNIAAAQDGTPQAAGNASRAIGQNNIMKQNLLKKAGTKIAQIQSSPLPPPPTSFWQKIKQQIMPPGGFGSDAAGYVPPAPPSANMENQGSNKKGLEVPDTGPVPQFSINQHKINFSQYLGNQPGAPPNQITPGESAAVQAEVGKVKAMNDKINLIHQNFAELWKNRSDMGPIAKYLGGLGANIGGAHLTLPDLHSLSESQRNYYRAATALEQELSDLTGTGGLTEQQAESIREKFIKTDDTPEQYKSVLKSIDDNLISKMQTPYLDKYPNLIKRPKLSK